MSAALFDMDGTLVDREPLAAQALVDVFAAMRWSVGDDDLAQLHGRAWQDVHRELDVATNTGWSEAEFIERVVGQAHRLAASGFPVRVLEGAPELVCWLHERGVALALVTGSTRDEVVATLAPLGVLDMFTVIVSSEDYAHGKPAPDAYLQALLHLGHEATGAVAFEDSAAGVRAARAAGLRVVGTEGANPDLDHPAHQDLSQADLVVPHLADDALREWLEVALAE
jgi:beta-phosphoglucomutase-like phosphatase (HAD superfamily)